MTLKGDLSEFDLHEILNLISDRKKTGHLTLKRGKDKAIIHFNKGRICYIDTPYSKDSLFFKLEDKGVMPGGSSSKLKAESMSDTKQKELIIEKKLLKNHELNEFLLEELGRDLAELLFWKDAEFIFESKNELTEIVYEFKLEDALSEAISKSVNLRDLKKQVPAETETIHLKKPSSPDNMITLDAKQMELVFCLSRERTMDDLRIRFGRDSFEFYETVSTLIMNNVLENIVAESGQKKSEKEEGKRSSTNTPDKNKRDNEKLSEKEPTPIHGKYISRDDDRAPSGKDRKLTA